MMTTITSYYNAQTKVYNIHVDMIHNGGLMTTHFSRRGYDFIEVRNEVFERLEHYISLHDEFIIEEKVFRVNNMGTWENAPRYFGHKLG